MLQAKEQEASLMASLFIVPLLFYCQITEIGLQKDFLSRLLFKRNYPQSNNSFATSRCLPIMQTFDISLAGQNSIIAKQKV